MQVVDGQQGARMSGGEAAFFQKFLDRGFELQEADGVGDGGAVFAGALRDLFLRELKLIDEALKSVGLLNGIEILALQIFDEGHFECEFFGNIAQDDWHTTEASALGGAPTALTRDQLKTIGNFSDDERLDDAARLNRARKFVERFFAEARARLIGARVDEIDIDVKKRFVRSRRYCRRRLARERVNRRQRHLRLLLRRPCRILVPDQCSQSPA